MRLQLDQIMKLYGNVQIQITHHINKKYKFVHEVLDAYTVIREGKNILKTMRMNYTRNSL